MVERGERGPKIQVKDNEGIRTSRGNLSVTVDIEKLGKRLERELPTEQEPGEIQIFFGKRPFIDVALEQFAPELCSQRGLERAITTNIVRASNKILFLPRRSVFSPDKDSPWFYLNIPSLALRASSKENLQERLVREWQHEESHLFTSRSEAGEASRGKIRLKILIGYSLTGAGIGFLAGTTASPEVASQAGTALSGVAGLIGGWGLGQALTGLAYLIDPVERRARKAAESVDPELLEIFKVIREK
jgi:hypothetical protein